jgi:hypothetical protein
MQQRYYSNGLSLKGGENLIGLKTAIKVSKKLLGS